MARKLVVEIIGDASSLEKSFKQASGHTNTFGDSLKRVGKIAAFTAGGAALGGLALVLKRSVETANEHAKIYAQTNAVIKSTGRAAGVSAKEVTKFADATEKLTGVDDVAIQKGENMLLTFTNVRNGVGKNNKIFTEATKTLVDMSVALGGDPQKNAIRLGKALNDPVKGVGALKKVGVTFTEGQKKTIEALVKGGKTMQAQKVILRELNKEFGGSAKAFGRTLPGQIAIFKARLDDVAQTIGEKLIPVLAKGLKVLSDLLAIFTGSGSASDKFKAALERMGVQAETAKRVIDDLKETFNALRTVVVTTFNIIRPVLEAFLTQIQGIVQLLNDLIHGRWSKIWGDAVTIVRNTVNLWVKILKTGITLLGGVALSIGKAIANGILNGLKGLAAKIIALIVAPVNAIIRAINSLVGWTGIHLNEIGVPGGKGKTPPAATLPGGSKTGTAGPQGPQTMSTAPGGGGFRTTQGVTVNVGTVVANNPQEFISGMQRWARRQSPSRSGPFAGHNLGLT